MLSFRSRREEQRLEGVGRGEALVKCSVHQKRLVSVVCDGLRHSWPSMPPCTEVSTEVTVGMVGFVKSVRVVGVLEGLMEALEISEAGPDGVPPCSVEPSDALSTPVLSCRSRFLLNLARAFWNQTCGNKILLNKINVLTAGNRSTKENFMVLLWYGYHIFQTCYLISMAFLL